MNRLAVVVLTVLACAASLVACSEDDAEQVTGRPQPGLEGSVTTVVVPAGAIEVTVAEAVDEVSAGDADDGEEHRPPRGWRYLPVQVAFGRADPTVVNTSGKVDAPVAVSIDVGDESYDLPAPYTVDAEGRAEAAAPVTTYVPTRSEGDVVVSVDYDGLEQRLGTDGSRDAGVAEAYYDGTAVTGGELDCTEGWTAAPDVDVDIGCRLRPTITPYLPGLGWADEGRTYVEVDTELLLTDLTIDGRTPPRAQPRLTPSIEDGSEVTPAEGTGIADPVETPDMIVKTLFLEAPRDGQHLVELGLEAWGVAVSASVALTP
ncbi:hypothetical protein ABFT23_18950 [Nocardioides sp. C4-1]|uniref:hypothetical protein n=1 Tax=Nocardioides sp. C4-1 TaxID=3151851 RepID=UPI0032641779